MPIGGSSHSTSLLPDLEIRVITDYAHGRTAQHFLVSSPSGAVDLPLTEIPGPVFRGEPSDFQAAQIRKIELLNQSQDVDQSPLPKSGIEAKLAGLGRDLYAEMFPPEMRALYRRIRADITTLHILSDEPFIPWEVIKPFDKDDPANIIDDDFLCLQFQLTRWLAGAGSAPKAVFSKNIACVVALGSGRAAPLLAAARERTLFADLQQKYPRVQDLSLEAATCDSLVELLGTAELGLLHFAGHGDYNPDSPNESSLSLDRPFRASDLHGSLTAEISLNKPLVFLNACRVGRQGLSATGLGGWAHRFVRHCNCGAFLGPQWEVQDELAFAFAQVFYELVASGASFGHAVREARKKVHALDKNNPTWLAFSLFAHPGARLIFGHDPNRGQNFSDSERAARGLPTPVRIQEPGSLPLPPQPYVAHRYTLMPTSDLIGRQSELDMLNRWVAGSDQRTRKARIFSLTAIGGMGKSALTWKWFNHHAEKAMAPLAGRFWWSFYEHDATFERFLNRALAYATGRKPSVVAEISSYDQEDELLTILDERPFLLVLDGLERILIAYARLDAQRLLDDDLDQKAAHHVQGSLGDWARLDTRQTGGQRLRQTQDPRAGNFLRQLAGIRASRILVSSRLYPADLQDHLTGHPLPGCTAFFLHGLQGADSMKLWRALGGGGETPEVVPIFDHIEHHPLVLRALAGEVAAYRPAPGNFKRWRADHPHFEPGRLPLVQARSHILSFALRGLEVRPQRVAQTIAALRMPAHYEALTAILVGNGNVCPTDTTLTAALDELENRGVSGWDRNENQYEMHPLVRNALWSHLDPDHRKLIDEDLRRYFAGMPEIFQYQVVEPGMLTPAVELCNVLTRLGRYDDAYQVYHMRIGDAVLDYLNSHMAIEIFELFFPNGIDQEPCLSDPLERAVLMTDLAQAYELNGQLFKAGQVLLQVIRSAEATNQLQELGFGLSSWGPLALRMGHLEKAEQCALRLVSLQDDKSYGNILLGQCLLIRGQSGLAEECFERLKHKPNGPAKDGLDIEMSHLHLRTGKPRIALTLIERTMEAQEGLANFQRSERFDLMLLRLIGKALLDLDQPLQARENLEGSITRALAINAIEDECGGLIALAETYLRLGTLDKAKECLEEARDPLERGSLRLLQADACNVETAIELAAGSDRAGELARRAYELAWCDGPPFTYHWGLEKARAHLRALGLSEPILKKVESNNGAC